MNQTNEINQELLNFRAEKSKVQAAERSLYLATEQFKAFATKYACSKFGVELQKTKVKHEKCEYLADEWDDIRYWDGKDRPWLYGRMIRKNGQPSANRRHLFSDWEVIL